MTTQLSKTDNVLAIPLRQADQIRDRLSGLRISPKTIELVVAQQAGTLIGQADEERLRAMWNEVIGLLDIRLSDEERSDHVAQMKIMSGWVRREYPDLTCESVRRAYNLAVKGELELEEVFSRIAPKYVGAVLRAYKKYLANDVEYSRVHQQQLLLQTKEAPTPEQIHQQMAVYLQAAIAQVRRGEDYADPGNGLYHWLSEQGHINPSPTEQKAYMDRAIPEVKALLNNEKEATESSTPGGLAKRKQLGQLIQDAINHQATPDYVTRVQAHAKYLYLNDYLKTLL